MRDPHALDFVYQQHKIRLCPSRLVVTGGTGARRATEAILAWYWSQSAVGWLAAVLLAAAGVVLLAGYGVARRRWPLTPLPRFFPALAVSVFGAIGLAFLLLELGTSIGIYDPRPLIAVCLALALGYAVRLGQARLRQR